jgi:transposase
VGKEAKYVVRLTGEERLWLEQLVSGKRVAAAKALRARMLLKADADGPAWTDSQIAEAFEVGESTVHRLRERLVQEGLEAAVSRKPHSQTKPRKLDGAQEAHLVAIACSAPPQGRARWTLSLLADRLVELKVVDSIGRETVRETLKKTTSNRGSSSSG